MSPQLRADLAGMTPYGAPQLDVPIRLNVNENPFEPSTQLVAAIAQAVAETATSLNRYPDRDATALRADLANYIARESGADLIGDNVWAANGSNEVMHHLLLAFGGPGRTLLTFTPSYSMYGEYCRDTFTQYVAVPRRDDYSIDAQLIHEAVVAHSPDIIVLASPNNPTGTVLSLDDVRALCESFAGLVIIDEAYAEFRAVGTPSATTLISEFSNLVVTRTMSKAFSCAGLRLGYALANPAIIAGCQIVRLPYHLSAVTQAVARIALAHADELLAQVDLLRQERDALFTWLIDNEFQAVPSGANFVMFGQFADRDAIWQSLLDRGILIRQVGPDGWLRVSIGTPDENKAFRHALIEVTSSK